MGEERRDRPEARSAREFPISAGVHSTRPGAQAPFFVATPLLLPSLAPTQCPPRPEQASDRGRAGGRRRESGREWRRRTADGGRRPRPSGTRGRGMATSRAAACPGYSLAVIAWSVGTGLGRRRSSILAPSPTGPHSRCL